MQQEYGSLVEKRQIVKRFLFFYATVLKVSALHNAIISLNNNSSTLGGKHSYQKMVQV